MTAINPISRTSVVLLMPGLATLICSAIAMMAAATMRTSTHESLYPRKSNRVASRISKDVLPDDVQDQDIEKSRHETESASPFAGGSIPAYDYGFRMVCI